QIYCIDKVLRGYIDLAPEKFMALPVNEAPWSRAYKKGDAIISKETLLDYYAGLLVPDKMKDKIQVEMGSPRCFEENNSHRNMADDQVASVSESPNDIDEEKNKLIEERNKLVEETNKLIEETNKLIEETNQVNVPIRRWKRSRKKLKRKLKANYGRDRLAYASERK
ncbi:MAG: hypothetical protein LBT59_24110, partial [Clostridiales bacterium]|nr:hypothetical protein [Clostridiales bacterium]